MRQPSLLGRGREHVAHALSCATCAQSLVTAWHAWQSSIATHGSLRHLISILPIDLYLCASKKRQQPRYAKVTCEVTGTWPPAPSPAHCPAAHTMILPIEKSQETDEGVGGGAERGIATGIQEFWWVEIEGGRGGEKQG